MENENNFLKLAADRYSVRKFKTDKISKDKIDLILKAGHLAPTGCNNQPQRILVIQSDEGLSDLKECTKYHFDAPAAMLVCYDTNACWKRFYDGKTCGEVDASIVCTHMMMEAAEIGIGSTWVMSFRPTEMRQKFNIPDEFEPVALLTLGYPADDAKPFAGHNEFKPMEETVFYDKF